MLEVTKYRIVGGLAVFLLLFFLMFFLGEGDETAPSITQPKLPATEVVPLDKLEHTNHSDTTSYDKYDQDLADHKSLLIGDKIDPMVKNPIHKKQDDTQTYFQSSDQDNIQHTKIVDSKVKLEHDISNVAPALEQEVDPQPKKDSSASTEKGVWFAQVASFTTKDRAHDLLQDMYSHDIRGVLKEAQVNHTPVFRVLIGPVSSKEKAEQLGKRLLTQFKLDSFIVQRLDIEH